MTPACIPPGSTLQGLEATLAQPRYHLVAEGARRSFTAVAGPPSPDDAFFLLWSVLDFDARPCLAERLLADGVAPPLAEALHLLVGSAPQLYVVEAGGGHGRQLVEVLTGRPWCSALARLAPLGSLVYTRFAGDHRAPWPAGPVALFPPASRDVLCCWLLERYLRARAAGQVVDERDFYRREAPALYRWWHAQRRAVARGRGPEASAAEKESEIKW